MSIPLGHLLVGQRVAQRELLSARPDAPVVPHLPTAPDRPLLRRTRALTAAVLFRAAARVSPA